MGLYAHISMVFKSRDERDWQTLDGIGFFDTDFILIEVWDRYPDEAEYNEDGTTDSFLFDFHSESYRAIAFLQERYANAEIIAFYVMDEKTIRAVISEDLYE